MRRACEQSTLYENRRRGKIVSFSVLPYSPKYEKDFIRLNCAWLEQLFTIEEADREILDHVSEWIARGAQIFFAVEQEEVLATCMAHPLENTHWKLGSFAAKGMGSGKGAGSAVFEACKNYAISRGATRLTVVSNRTLSSALHVYRKFGFVEVPLEERFTNLNRANIQFDYIVK